MKFYFKPLRRTIDLDAEVSCAGQHCSIVADKLVFNPLKPMRMFEEILLSGHPLRLLHITAMDALLILAVMNDEWLCERGRSPRKRDIESLFHQNTADGFKIIANLGIRRELPGELGYGQNLQYVHDRQKWDDLQQQARDHFFKP